MSTLTPEQLDDHARRLIRFIALNDLHTVVRDEIDPAYQAVTITFEPAELDSTTVSITQATVTHADGTHTSPLETATPKSTQDRFASVLDDLADYLIGSPGRLGSSPVHLTRLHLEQQEPLPDLFLADSAVPMQRNAITGLNNRHHRQAIAVQLLGLINSLTPPADALTLHLGLDDDTQTPVYEAVTFTDLRGESRFVHPSDLTLPDAELVGMIFELYFGQDWTFTRQDLQPNANETLPLPHTTS